MLERSTGVRSCSAVTTLRGSSPGSSQNGVLSWLASARKARVRRSIARSSAGSSVDGSTVLVMTGSWVACTTLPTVAPRAAAGIRGAPGRVPRHVAADPVASGPPPEDAVRMLRGRAREREMLDELLEAVRGGAGRALVVRGEPGIGKTALLEYAVASAPDLRVVRAAGYESEMELAFAALHQVCAPLLDRLDHLPEP